MEIRTNSELVEIVLSLEECNIIVDGLNGLTTPFSGVINHYELKCKRLRDSLKYTSLLVEHNLLTIHK